MKVYLDTEELYDRVKGMLKSGEMTTNSVESIILVFDSINPDFTDLLKELVARTKEENGE